MQQVLPARSSCLQVLLVVLYTLFDQCASDCTDETTTTVYFAALLSQADQKSCNRAQLSFQVRSRSAALLLIRGAAGDSRGCPGILLDGAGSARHRVGPAPPR